MKSDNFLQPTDDKAVPVASPEDQMPNLATYIRSKFNDAEHGRYVHEQNWITAYKNFRGIYDSSTQYRDSERSKVFIKITKTKVLAAYGQLADILFSNKKFPIVVEPTPVPEGISRFAHAETPADQISNPYGFQGDGRDIPAGASNPDFLGGLAQKYSQMPLKEGPSKMGEPQISPAMESAKQLEKVIHDQLLDTNAVTVFRNAIFESSLLGTGVIKGPFNHYKKYIDGKGEWMEIKVIPLMKNLYHD